MGSAPSGIARVFAAALAVVVCLGGAGCGGGDAETASRKATLVLDFVPGPVHAGIYRALAAGYYEDEGIDLEVVEPTSTADTLKLIDAGKAEFGIADGLDVAGQIDAGRDAQAVMAIAQEPLGGVITLARSGFRSPADLAGRTVGVTGVPSDDAILDTVVAAAGADPDAVDRVTIGFNGVQSLEAGKIDGFTGFVPADGVQADVDGYPTRSFGPRRWGGLTYPGLVVFSTREEIASDPDLVGGFVAATVHGYEDVLADPGSGADALLAANPAIDPTFARRSLHAYLPYLSAGERPFGSLDAAAIAQMSDFMVDSGLIDSPIPPRRYADFSFTGGGGG
jgi:NitT/TauT family transport system substrate-binding protein/putative hydroxymethylpyrimidine transport system substrate-binding protein